MASRALCPPDEARGMTAHDGIETDTETEMETETPLPPALDFASKPASADVDAPSRDTPTPTSTPMTAADDGADEQQQQQRTSQTSQTSQSPPLAASAPAPISLVASHLSSPFPARRVCATLLYSKNHTYTCLPQWLETPC